MPFRHLPCSTAAPLLVTFSRTHDCLCASNCANPSLENLTPKYVFFGYPILSCAELPCGCRKRVKRERFVQKSYRRQFCGTITIRLRLSTITEYSGCLHRALSALQIKQHLLCPTYLLWNIIGCRGLITDVARRLVPMQYGQGCPMFNEFTEKIL